MTRTHREVFLDCICATERNCKMFFGWGKDDEISVDLAADAASTDLAVARGKTSWEAEKQFAEIKLQACIKYIMGAHRIEEGSPRDVALYVSALEWIGGNKRDVEPWWEAAQRIYKSVFMKTAGWHDESTTT